ncbi:MAG TPA: PhzF family phenazine biosynthesis protein [Burkholderiaceae bacterium]|nr:PhzF family phenazine biosynthesis protein [Burkholderiaceae bacterium]
MKLSYCTLDVFTDRHFGGNPLAVVFDAQELDDATMQAVAREFNYSETSFVQPPSDPSYTARVRIFTPGGELPFAGHPTVGTAFAMASLGRIGPGVRDIVFEEGVGPVPVRVDRDPEGAVQRCTLTTAQAPELVETLEDEQGNAAAMLGLPESAVLSSPEVWSCGVPFLVVPLADVGALSAARLEPGRWRGLLEGRSTQKVYPVARSGDATWRVRMFAPSLGVAEDPATGSAAAAMAGWLARRIAGDGDRSWQIVQGEEVGRRSIIDLGYKQTGNIARRVRVGGRAVMVTRGTLTL